MCIFANYINSAFNKRDVIWSFKSCPFYAHVIRLPNNEYEGNEIVQEVSWGLNEIECALLCFVEMFMLCHCKRHADIIYLCLQSPINFSFKITVDTHWNWNWRIALDHARSTFFQDRSHFLGVKPHLAATFFSYNTSFVLTCWCTYSWKFIWLMLLLEFQKCQITEARVHSAKCVSFFKL